MTERDQIEAIAMSFHAAYEKQAPAFGYETRPESALPWSLVPEENRALMVSVVATLLAHDVIAPGARIDGVVCSICDARYDDEATLKRHVFERHPDGSGVNPVQNEGTP